MGSVAGEHVNEVIEAWSLLYLAASLLNSNFIDTKADAFRKGKAL
jgi:hypothetical protein